MTTQLFDIEKSEFPRKRPRRRWPWVVLVVVGAAAVAAFVLFLWVQRQLHPSGPVGAEVRVTVREGMSTSAIGHLLEERGVIVNATVFRYYARFTGAGSIQAGDYTLRRRQDVDKVLEILEGGAEEDLDRLTIPEGLTLLEIADKVAELPGRSRDRFLAAARSGTVHSQFQPPDSDNLEGLLLPETYFVDRDDDETVILSRMVEAFDRVANELNLTGEATALGVTPYQAVIVASLIEREARVHEDRGPIARVVYNRLELGMPLQIDATVQYALGKQKERLLNRDLEIDSPYNTYRIPGLPPGPIASPGRPALEAALHPAPGTWLYYVLSDADGRHAFATTGAEFERFKAEAQAKGLL